MDKGKVAELLTAEKQNKSDMTDASEHRLHKRARQRIEELGGHGEVLWDIDIGHFLSLSAEAQQITVDRLMKEQNFKMETTK